MSNLSTDKNNQVHFTSEEIAQYNRQLILPEIGAEGQRKLKQARVLVVGAGGLGSPVLQYLGAAGVGTIGIVDGDVVDTSNLHRQVLYTHADVGSKKAEVARKRLLALNPHIHIIAHAEHLTRDNALDLISQYDIVADGTDNFPTRYLVNDACVLTNKINVYASIFRFEGQVAVFNYPLPNGRRSANYRDLYPTPPPPEAIPNCAESGVLGVLPGIVGSMQANEVIKLITGIGEPLIGKLFLYDAKDCRTQLIQTKRVSEVTIDGLIDYNLFCDGVADQDIKSITVEKLRQLLRENADFQLIDVREPHEHAVENLGGELIPLDTITREIQRIASNRQIIIYCQSGKRSQEAIRHLRQIINGKNLYNLEGGMAAWKQLPENKKRNGTSS